MLVSLQQIDLHNPFAPLMSLTEVQSSEHLTHQM